jgi:hypothetical protein
MILFVAMYSTNHGEPDQEFKSWHSINGIANDNIPKIIIVHDSGYDNMFICPFVTGRLYHDQNSKLVLVNSGRLNKMIRAGGIFANRLITQWEATVHIDLSACSKSVMCEDNQVVVMSSYIPQSSLTRTHNASAHHYFSAQFEYFYPPPPR